MRNNVRYLPSAAPGRSGAGGGGGGRSVIYHAAAMGIVMDPSRGTQRYFKGHKDDITGIAFYTGALPEGSRGTIVATGQQGLGDTFVWQADTMQILATLQTKQKTVHMLEFSSDGRLLVRIGRLFDWPIILLLI